MAAIAKVHIVHCKDTPKRGKNKGPGTHFHNVVSLRPENRNDGHAVVHNIVKLRKNIENTHYVAKKQ